MNYHDLTVSEAAALRMTAAQPCQADAMARRLVIGQEVLTYRLARLVSAGYLA